MESIYDYTLDYYGNYVNDVLGTNNVITINYYRDLFAQDNNNEYIIPDTILTGYKNGNEFAFKVKLPDEIKKAIGLSDTTEEITVPIKLIRVLFDSKYNNIDRPAGLYQYICVAFDEDGDLERDSKYFILADADLPVFPEGYKSPSTVGKIVKDQDIGDKNAATIIQLMFSNLQLTVPTFTTNFALSTFPTKMYIGKSSSFGGNFTIGSYKNGSYGDTVITSTKTSDLKISLSKTVSGTFTFATVSTDFNPSTGNQTVSTIAYSGTSSYSPTSLDFGKNISFKLSGGFKYTNPQTNKSVSETISSTITSTVYQYYYYGYSTISTDTDIDTFKTKTLESSSTFSSLTTTAISEFDDKSNKYLMVAIPGTMGGSASMTLTMTPTLGGQPAQLQYVNSTSLNSDTYFIYCSGSANASWAAYKITK